MNIEKWNKVKEIFTLLADLPVSERENALNRAEVEDDEIRNEVKKLLASDENARSLFDGLSIVTQENALLKDKIGNYKILRKIGAGGMGAVYLAERADLAQKVALKIIRRGVDSDIILRRFRREQEILSQLEHPNIARLLDIGIGGDNLPFLAMEYVEGTDLIQFCRQNECSINERLKIFRKACEAVSYAHSRLIVHRDLKPSKILVNEKGEPKLLDFGISKLLSENENQEKGTVTSYGMLTPNYASPEQFRGLTVTTATDVYSLGVILYEILTGALPYNITDRRPDEVARAVCETNPQKPSEAVSQQSKIKTHGNNRQATDKNRKTNPKNLRGDLDNIVLKALRKEPERRYSSVEQFSEDINRYLTGLPITARRDTFGYRATKFIGRNKILVGSAALVALALIAGVVGTSWQAVRAERQRTLAEKRFGEVRALANNAVFKYYEQIKDLDGATEARETLVKDATEYLDKLAQDAGGDVSLQRDLVKAYFRLGDVLGAPHAAANTGDTAGALENYAKADAIIDNLLAESPDTIEFKGLKRNLHTKIGEVNQRAGNVEETSKNFRAAVELSEQIVKADPKNPTHLSALGQAYILYGETLTLGLGEDESVAVASKGLTYLDAALAIAPNESVPLQRMNMANVHIGLQIYNLAREAEEVRDPSQAADLYARASEQFQKAMETAEKLIAIDGKNVGFRRRLYASKFNESITLSGLGKTDDALLIQREILDETEKSSAEAANAEAQFDLAQVYSQWV